MRGPISRWDRAYREQRSIFKRISQSQCKISDVMFAIKAEVNDPPEETILFSAQKTMYDGKRIAAGDAIFVFASENEGGKGLIARGVVTAARAIAKKTRDRPANTAREYHGSDVRRSRSGAWDEANSNRFPTGTTAAPRPSSISNSIVRQRTRSSVFQRKRRHFSANSSNAVQAMGA